MFKRIQDHLDSENSGLEGTLQIGIVVDNNDSHNTLKPGKFSRIKVRISLLHSGHSDSDLPWALPMMSSLFGAAPGIGTINIPAIGSKVGIFIPSNDPTNTYYIGATSDASNTLAALAGANYPNVFVHQNAAGDLIFIDPVARIWILNMVDGTIIKIAGGMISIAASAGYKLNVTGDVDIMASGAVNISGTTVNLNPASNAASSVALVTRTAPAATTFNNQVDY